MAAPRLNTSLLARLKGVKVPTYSRELREPGIVHIGLGAFHRAHQAVYSEEVLKQGDMRWGTIGASLRSSSTRDALAPQDFLYSLCIRDQDQHKLQVLGGLIDILMDANALISAIANPSVQVVTLTITEKGYSGNDAHAGAPAILASALARRMESRSPLTILSCDNLIGNGDVLREVVRNRFSDPGLASWMEDQVAFPNSMVDRIVPRTTATDRALLESSAGYADASPVVCEPFSSWVIEDDFRAPRPEWELGGARFVKDVGPYEQAKLRLLNASHSLLAYLGLLKGYEFIHEAVADADLRTYLLQTLELEIKPFIEIPDGTDVDAYIASILRRFANSAVPYRTNQVASDGSHKLRQRIYQTLKAVWATGAASPRLELGLCAWLRTLAGRAENGTVISYDDPGAEPIRELIRKHPEGGALVRAISVETDLWSDFPQDALLRLEQAFNQLEQTGLGASLASLSARKGHPISARRGHPIAMRPERDTQSRPEGDTQSPLRSQMVKSEPI